VEVKDIISSGLLEMHVMGICTEAESAQVLAWTSQYPEVKEEQNAIELAMESYAAAYAITPSRSAKEKILTRVNSPENTTSNSNFTHTALQAPVVSINGPIWKYLAAASIILLIGSSILNYTYYNKLEVTTTAYEQTKTALLAANEKVNYMNEDLSIVRNKYSQPVSLNGLPAAPDAAAKIFLMKNTGELYIDPGNLPDAPEGKQYQLWGIVEGKPVDAGMILTTKKDNKYRIQKMKTLGNVAIQAFAVTLEDIGGKPQPEGSMFVMGEM